MKAGSSPPPGAVYEWQPRARRLLRNGEPLTIGTRALDVLAVLIEAQGGLVGKQELMERVWRELVVEENNLQVQVSALRKLLGPAAIATIPGRGYRLDLPGLADAPLAATPTAAPAPSGAGRLPLHLPALWGRDAELAELVERIRQHRLVTLVGPGGIGKTRLALAAAARLAPAFADGARLVELADLRDDALVLPAVATALDAELPRAASVAGWSAALRGRRQLVVIDNCEHLGGEAAAQVARLLAAGEGLHVLATSQTRLKLVDEQVQPLGPLRVPAADEPHPDERFGAIQLFVQRARAVQPDFRAEGRDAETLADICRQLDGVALAIELAAARVRVLGLQGLRDRVHERLRLLTQGPRDAPARQRTLQATLEWSFGLLEEAERTVLQRLAVFVGGFTLELAQQVAAGEALDAWAVLDALSGLVEKSLVAVDLGDPPRYRLLETTRAYALQRLTEAGERQAITARHATALQALFASLDAQRFAEGEALDADTLRARLTPEAGNVRAALAWAMGAEGDAQAVLSLATTSASLYMQLDWTQEALARLLGLRARITEDLEPRLACDFWRRLAMLGGYAGLEQALQRQAAEDAVRWARRAQCRLRLHTSLSHWGHVLLAEARLDEVDAVLQELQAIERPQDAAFFVVGRLGLQAACASARQRHLDAVAVMQEQISLLQRTRGEQVALLIARSNLAWMLNLVGRHAEAAELAAELLADARLPPGLRVIGFDRVFALAALGRVGQAQQALVGLRAPAAQGLAAPLLLHGGASLMRLARALGRLPQALRIDGACSAYRAARGLQPDALVEQEQAELTRACEAAQIPAPERLALQLHGQTLDDEACLALVLDDGDVK
ncbi:MAG: hypothetical protein AMXMBFR78_19680 [Rubrivivax sp.]